MSLWSEISLKIAANIDVCSFKVAILFFMRALLKQKGYRTIESALGVDESGRERSWSWRERSCKSAPYLNSPKVSMTGKVNATLFTDLFTWVFPWLFIHLLRACAVNWIILESNHLRSHSCYQSIHQSISQSIHQWMNLQNCKWTLGAGASKWSHTCTPYNSEEINVVFSIAPSNVSHTHHIWQLRVPNYNTQLLPEQLLPQVRLGLNESWAHLTCPCQIQCNFGDYDDLCKLGKEYLTALICKLRISF